ncbi:MAG: hypothetical protein DHS20C15_00240 [Planctomycetota bacterium]|nr:MAG: hypothetical protein DHS20C15_00240 [Planctomycetota bacterium]
MNTRVVVALLIVLAGAAALFMIPEPPSPEDLSAGAPATRVLQPLPSALQGGPNACLPCHAQVVDEWRRSMHSQAFTDPQVRAPEQSDNFRKTECLPCHAPRPVFAFGIEEGTRVLARGTRQHDGIDCLSCHDLGNGHIAGTMSFPDAACVPQAEPRLSTPALCAPCHDQHNLHQEWLVSPAAERGQDCNSCHMPHVQRPAANGLPAREGRSHDFPGGRDREFAVAGLELSAELDAEQRELIVQLTNTFAAHNLPSDSRNRALDLVVTLRDLSGRALPAIPDLGDRHPGGETGTARQRFRNPYRSSGNPSTQLPAGETAELRVPVEGAVSAEVEVYYKLQPWIPDSEAAWKLRQVLDLP